VAICNFAILIKSSVLVAADVFVRGVPTELPPLTEPVGVESVTVPMDFPLAFTDPFAAFSASRFCFDAEGGIMCEGEKVRLTPIDQFNKKKWRSLSVSRHMWHVIILIVLYSTISTLPLSRSHHTLETSLTRSNVCIHLTFILKTAGWEGGYHCKFGALPARHCN